MEFAYYLVSLYTINLTVLHFSVYLNANRFVRRQSVTLCSYFFIEEGEIIDRVFVVDKTLFSIAHRYLHACAALRSVIAPRRSKRFVGLEFPYSLGYPPQNTCVSFCRSLPALSSSF